MPPRSSSVDPYSQEIIDYDQSCRPLLGGHCSLPPAGSAGAEDAPIRATHLQLCRVLPVTLAEFHYHESIGRLQRAWVPVAKTVLR